MFDDLANELKTAREKNSMTLAQVANKSKIDIKFLEAIEQGDFAFLPDLYVRAFIKNFARTVGLDENKIIKKFEASKQGVPYVEEEAPPKETKIRPLEIAKQDKALEGPKLNPIIQSHKPEIKKKDSLFSFDAVGGNNPIQDSTTTINRRNLIIGGSVLGIIILFTLIYFLFIDKSEQIIVVEKPIEDVIKQNQRYVESDQTTNGSNLGVGITDSLVLTINANDTSWIKVSIDGQASGEFILLPNSQKIIKAKTNYKITFGNSGAINLQLNNRPLSFSGVRKSASNVLIDKEGLKYSDDSSQQR
jgi:transcriptional regulator with XRE-family HTH domain